MPPIQTISHTTITFQSDIPSSDRSHHTSGILHIVKNFNHKLCYERVGERDRNNVHAVTAGSEYSVDDGDDGDDGDSDDNSGDDHGVDVTARDNDGRGGEEHMFIWLHDKSRVENANNDDDDDDDDYDDDDDDDDDDDYDGDHHGKDGFLSKLIQQVYDDDPTNKIFFLPYSSKANWVHRYPHAVPCMECDEDGRIKDPAYFQQRISNGPPNAATQSASSATSYNARNTNNSNSYNNNDAIIRPTKRIHNNKKRNRQGNTTNCTSPSSISIIPTLPALPNLPTNLFDLEHCQHHIRIYNYFSSLHSNLLELLFYQTKKIRKHVIRKAGVSVTAIRDLLTDLERAFGNVREFNKTKNKMRVDEIELAMKGGDEDEEGLEDDGDDADAKNDDENNSANNSIIHNEETVKSEDEKEEDAPPPSSSSHPAFPLMNIMEEKKKYSHLPPSPPFAEVDESDLILLPISHGKLGLSLQFYKSVIGAVVSGIDVGCKFQQYITIGDRLITIDGNVVSTARDISDGKDKKMGRLFGIAKKGMSEERLNQLCVEEYGYGADTPAMTRDDDAAIRCVVSRGKTLPDDIRGIISSRRHWPLKTKRIENFASNSLTRLRLCPGIHHATAIENLKSCTLCCVDRDTKRKTKTMCSTCQIPLCTKLIGDATETCFEKWHSRDDLVEAHMEQCGHLLEQRRKSRESGRWAHARSVRRRVLDGSGGGGGGADDVAPMEANEDENSIGGDGDGVIEEDAVPEDALEDAPVKVEEDGSLV